MARRFLITAAFLVGLYSSSYCDTPSTKPSIEKLIEQLGDPSFRVRETAVKELEQRGVESLPLLKEALQKTSDAEVSRRLQKLIPELELKALLAPQRISVAFVNKPVREAMEEVSRQTGYGIEIWPERGFAGPREDRRITLELNEVPFWEALDHLCRAGELSFQQSWSGHGRKDIRLHFEKDSHSGIVQIQGPFRISLENFSYGRSVNFRGGNDSRREPLRNESLSAHLNIAVEPKLPLLGVGRATVLEAIDEVGESNRPSPWPHELFDHMSSSHGIAAHVHLSLTPTLAGKRLQLLKGTIPLIIVAKQSPKITIENLITVKNQTFGEEKNSITIQDAVWQGKELAVRLSLREADAQGQSNLVGLQSLEKRLAVFDEQGRRYRHSGHRLSGGGNAISGTVEFSPVEGMPPVPAAPLKLVYYEWETMKHEVAFEFRDVPLP